MGHKQHCLLVLEKRLPLSSLAMMTCSTIWHGRSQSRLIRANLQSMRQICGIGSLMLPVISLIALAVRLARERSISTCVGLARLLPMHGASFGAAVFFFTHLMRVRATRLAGFGWFMRPIRWRFWLRPLAARPLTVMALFLIWCRKHFMPACHLFLALLMKLTHLPAIGHK